MNRIEKTGNRNDRINKRGISEDFKIWFQQEQGARKMPKGEELFNYMDKKYGQYTAKGWLGIRFIQPEEEEEDIDL